ncbi:hypothetical protein ACQJBY_004185 [Aegilops geniculata]
MVRRSSRAREGGEEWAWAGPHRAAARHPFTLPVYSRRNPRARRPPAIHGGRPAGATRRRRRRSISTSTSTSSAASRTSCSAPSSRSSPPRTARARRPSPAGSARSGAPPWRRSTSSPTTTSPKRTRAPHWSPGSSPTTPARPAASRSSSCSSRRASTRSTAGSAPGPSPASTNSRPPTFFAPTLRVLSLGGCRFPDLAPRPSFPHLKQLILYDVGISEGSPQSVISGCRVLQSVSLHNMGFGRLCIRSPTLRSIGFYAPHTQGVFQELVIEDAPCLERLLPLYPDDGPATIRVIRAPKLEILGFLSEGISTLHLGSTVFQKMFAVSLTTKMYTMKILALDSIGPNLGAVIDFLKCFPCLEKLHVISHPQKAMNNNMRKFDPLERIECLELHLKKVVLKNYNADKSPAVDFANFFILNAKVLEEMEIGVLHDVSYRSMCDKWMRDQHMPLQLDNRASQNAQIELRRDGKAIPANHGHTHDLSMTDPFDKSSCGCVKCVRYI